MKLGPIKQIAYVVPDVEAAVAHWAEQFGAGPFYIIPGIRFPGWTYLGEPQDLPVDIVVGQLGGQQIEFVRPHSDVPSVYSHAIADRPVLHHYGLLVDDLEAAIERAGNPPTVTSGHSALGTPFTYNDTRPQLDVMVELITTGPDVMAMFDLVERAAVGWDGRNPLREMPAV